MFEYDNTLVTDIENERQERLTNTKVYPYGIKFLDDALNGFTTGELILVGSKSGKGKSQLCNIIAEANARQGNKCLYIALEAESREVGRRIKFRNLSKLYFELNPQYIYPLSYGKWRRGQLEQKVEALDKMVEEDLKSFGNNIIIKYKERDFTAENITSLIIQYNKDVDFIILDHLHYVDMFETNENVGLKHIIKTIRNLNLDYKKPIILVTHLRKTDKRTDSLVPHEEDVHGTSDIFKIATTAIFFSPQMDGEHESLVNTYFRIVKARGESDATRYIAHLVYDLRQQNYRDKYDLGKHKEFSKDFEPLTKKPEWDKGGAHR